MLKNKHAILDHCFHSYFDFFLIACFIFKKYIYAFTLQSKFTFINLFKN